MSGKLPRSAMSLKQFMVHQEVLKLYRNIMRTIRQVPDEMDRRYLRDWARNDFRSNRDIKDEFAIKSLIIHGENSLAELRRNLNRTKGS
ncbi:LYR motif-containing protein 2 [Neodiprion pinetum]|uniref:LYR motif-containing protein 2 n=1 Tax=Neodiprion lecontei TaxID=441921 RepID=A0A6J0CCM3_NEOLC|nr:LYR motif-containing protein 2 [Neodiprion lecontei]XP_015524185.1 LYR motif-containing protein 2 [Neodiprion lecontei]XP_046418550.1 LYR motif-containing protein 2 [Neodiprion fabricii]XP_046418551.1 LYR motif-containing protein 2 [Neodiprion fabricii]XP_046474339.1 LYR motif-containing protein 2 [Neodiprion pinetum]XP_046474340.1 LYR motif-containing protein 2 [Neodiprion pinetum]XP_046612260.1 LYR motif-containing protein 2 [Neodiprion virginianus]XP_046612261.1 LYR motif-containing pr